MPRRGDRVARLSWDQSVRPRWVGSAPILTHAQLLSRIRLFATSWTIRQAPLSMGCPRQKYWTDSHLLLQGISPDLGSNLHLLPWQGILYHQATREASAPITSSVSLSLCLSAAWQVHWPQDCPDPGWGQVRAPSVPCMVAPKASLPGPPHQMDRARAAC